MNKRIGQAIVLAALMAAATLSFGQQAAAPEKARQPEPAAQAQPDKAVVPLSNPAKPARIEASVLRGSITVKGYPGKEVIVEARVRERSLNEPEAWALAGPFASTGKAKPKIFYTPKPGKPLTLGEVQEEKKERSHEGMKQITAALTGLSVEEDDNTVTVNTESWKYAIDMTIQAPVNSSLEIGTMNDGKIVVENVSGDLEIGGGNGSITLRNVSGNVVAHTMSGDIEAVLDRVTPDKPMSFSTMNGDIDITLPADIKATVKMKSQQGNIYSDFDVAVKQMPAKSGESEAPEKGKYRISFDKGIYGTINGGGQEITFTTFTGDIFIRKKK